MACCDVWKYSPRNVVCVEYLWQWKKSCTCWWHYSYTPTVTNVYATVICAASSVNYAGRYTRCVVIRTVLQSQASRGFARLSPLCKKCELHRSTSREGPEGERRYRSTLSLDGCVFLMSRPGRFNPRKGLGSNCTVRTVVMVLPNSGPVRSRRLRFHITCSSAKNLATTAYVSPSNTPLVRFHSFSSWPPNLVYLLPSFVQFLRYSVLLISCLLSVSDWAGRNSGCFSLNFQTAITVSSEIVGHLQ